jgi:hypothetical protein
VDELGAERHVQVKQLGLPRLSAQARHGDEAVQVARLPRAGVEVDRVPTAEQTRHHRFGDAGGE